MHAAFSLFVLSLPNSRSSNQLTFTSLLRTISDINASYGEKLTTTVFVIHFFYP